MSVDTSQLRILVVDEAEEILELVGEYLRVRGLQVQTSPDSDLAQQLLKSGRFDMVLTDHRPPRVDATALLTEARQLARPAAVLVMTSQPTVEGAVSAFKGGAVDYVIKPFKLRDLYETLLTAAHGLESTRLRVGRDAMLDFYELAHGIEEEGQFPRLINLYLALLRKEAEAAEAAVWVSRGGVLQRAGHSGAGGILHALNPDEFYEARQGAAGLAAMPLRIGGRRIGVVAVAGGGARTPWHIARIRLVSRAFCSAVAHLAGGEHRTVRP